MKIKFFYQQFKRKKYWSNKKHEYYTSYDIQDQVWDSPEQPCKGECYTLYDILPRLPKNATKKTRSTIMRFPTNVFPLKENIGYNEWNGIIFVDLDLIKSKKYCDAIEAVLDDNGKLVKYNKEKSDRLYEAIKSILCNIANDNFYYIERSSSYVGVHIMFYFNVERTKDNFFKCAEYCKELLIKKFVDNDYATIEKFDEILSERSVFDTIYNRVYQKCYITGIEYYINEFITGNIDNNILNKFETKKEINNDVKSSYKISSKLDKIKNEVYDTDHNIRFYIYTALKKVTKSKDECNAIWTELCKKFKLYKDYTYNKFLNEFNYDYIDSSTAHINILERYGISLDVGETYYHLKENEYLWNIKEELLNDVTIGFNFWRAPTGSGKTVFWTGLNKEILNDILCVGMKKPILIVEPLNSIIETKYDGDVVTVTGHKQFPKIFSNYTMYVTNYNKLLKKTHDGYTLRDDIEEFFSNFEYIVIDESHIIIKDSFRCEVLVPFINCLNNISNKCKIILQTASPMDEDLLFDIKNKIIITKPPKAEIKYITRFSEKDKFSIQDITDMVDFYRSENRKVYIYWNNASLVQLKSFKQTYKEGDKVAIYHKRNIGEESMERISRYHLLEKHDTEDNYKYDVILSSVYFGVGNDLDDHCKAATIIIGNNTVQEDIQAIGRWRNSEDIEVCQIIMKNEYDFIKYTSENELNRKKVMVEEQLRLKKIWKDKSSKNKSVLIFGKSYNIKDEADIKPLSIMKSAETYYSGFKCKINTLEDPYYGIRCKHHIDRPLEINEDRNAETKEYWNSIKDIRNEKKRAIVSGNIDYDVINRDSNIEKFYRLWNKLKKYEIDKKIDLKYICSSYNYNILNIWVKYYTGMIANNIDYPELYAILWYVKWYDSVSEWERKSTVKIFNKEIYKYELYYIFAYVIFVHNKNKMDNDYRILFNYFGTFKWFCKLFAKLPKILINMFYNYNSYVDVTPTKIFFDEYEWKDEDFENIVINSLDDIKEQTKHIDNSIEKIKKVIKGCLFYLDNKKIEGNKLGGQKTKKVIVTDKFKRPEKYNLKIGQEFESCKSLGEYTKKSIQTVSQWINKSWISCK